MCSVQCATPHHTHHPTRFTRGTTMAHTQDPFTDVGVEFGQAAEDLDFAARRLEAAFHATAVLQQEGQGRGGDGSGTGGGAGGGGGGGDDVDLDNLPNPVQLVHRIRGMEEALPVLLEKMAALAQRKQVRKHVHTCACCIHAMRRVSVLRHAPHTRPLCVAQTWAVVAVWWRFGGGVCVAW